MTVIEKLTGKSIIETRISCYVIPEAFNQLTNPVQEQVTKLLEEVREKGMIRFANTDAEYLLKLNIINQEYSDLFLSIASDPRTSEEKEQAIEQARVEIF